MQSLDIFRSKQARKGAWRWFTMNFYKRQKKAFVLIAAVVLGSVALLNQLLETNVTSHLFPLRSTSPGMGQHDWPPLVPSSASPQAQNETPNGSNASKQWRHATQKQCPYRVDSLDEPAGKTAWHIGGWAVRRRCSQPLDTLFFVYTAPGMWRRRANLRATLFEEGAARFFNWTGVFFIGEQDNATVSLWTAFETQVMGDVVMLPYKDTHVSLIHKFVGGMRWVLEYCPRVRHVVKIDDDVAVHPFELRRYLDVELPLRDTHLHCFVIRKSRVYRKNGGRFCVEEYDLPRDTYFLYCSGRSVIMTLNTMRMLYAASKIVKVFPVDDAYVTGHLALFANVGHVFINDRFDWSHFDKTKHVLEKNTLFTHEHFAYGNSIERRAQWGLVLWQRVMDGGIGWNLSHRFEDKEYRHDFDDTRQYLLDSPLYTY